MEKEIIDDLKASSLAEFDAHVSMLKSKFSKSALYFRGQSEVDWKLESTLERANSGKAVSFIEYCRDIFKIAGPVQSVAGLTFELTDLQNIVTTVEKDSYDKINFIPNYPYWVYLRQHGYPSPMLDWSASPLIAAFFALWESKKDSVVWVYIERPEGLKLHGSDMTNIQLMGPFTPIERRHFIQQSVYTVAWYWENNNRAFKPYESIRSDLNQDIFVKIVLNHKMKDEALKYFDQANLNLHTLMQDVDSLMKYLSYREYSKK
jgi:hypothetical protein